MRVFTPRAPGANLAARASGATFAARAAVSGIALMAAGAACADVTAQDVWDNMQEALEVYGENGVTIGEEQILGSAISIVDLTLTMSDPETDVSMTIPSIVFTENGDGTVSVTISESYPIEITGQPDNRARLLVSQTGLEITVSGDPDELVYDFGAAKIAITMEELVNEGAPMEGDMLFAMNDVAGSYTSTTGDLDTVAYDVTSAGVDILIDIAEPDGSGALNFSGQVAELVLGGAVSTPEGMDMAAPETAFVDGFSVDVGYEFGQSAYLFDFQDGTDAANGTMTSSGGGFSLAIDYDFIDYASGFNDLAVSFTGSELPLPVEFTIGQFAMALAAPLSKSEEPSELSALFELRDLALSEMIWSMVDAGGQLPHDPASAVVRLTGLGRLYYDIMNPEEAAQAAQAGLPGELNSVTLDELTLQVAGAEVLGTGGFDFDFTDFQTIPGFPRPEGELNIAINGLNGLLDTLVQMGVIPEDQVMGPRMMLGVFATPVGDDMLESKIEINAEGHIIANGQRLQ